MLFKKYHFFSTSKRVITNKTKTIYMCSFVSQTDDKINHLERNSIKYFFNFKFTDIEDVA